MSTESCDSRHPITRARCEHYDADHAGPHIGGGAQWPRSRRDPAEMVTVKYDGADKPVRVKRRDARSWGWTEGQR